MNTIPTLELSKAVRLHHAYRNLKCENLPTDDSMCKTLHPWGDLNENASLLCGMSLKKDAEKFCRGMKECADDNEKELDFENCGLTFQNKFVKEHPTLCPQGIDTCATYCTLDEGGFGCLKTDA